MNNKRFKTWVGAIILTIAAVAYAHQDDTVVSRLELTHPDQGHEGVPALLTKVRNAWTKIGDNMNSRFEQFTTVADSTTVNMRHNFGVDIAETTVLIYTGSSPNFTRVSDPVAAGWTIAAGSPAKEVTDITTPGSGGPHTFGIVIIQGSAVEVLDDLDDVDVTTTPPEDGQALVFDSGASEWIAGASGDSSLKCQEVSDPNLTLKSGFLILDEGTELQVASDLTVDLDSVLGTNPANATAYYLYVDLDALPAESTLSSGRRVRILSLASHFSLQLAASAGPREVLQSRFVPICLIRSADAGTVWSGTGAVVETTATRRHGRPIVNVSPTVFVEEKKVIGAIGDSGQIRAGHLLVDDSFPTFTTQTSYWNLGDVSDDSSNARNFSQVGNGVFTGNAIDGTASTYDQDGTGDNLESTAAFFNGGDADLTMGCFVQVDAFAAGDIFMGMHGTTLNSWSVVQDGSDDLILKTSTGSSFTTIATITNGTLTDYNHWAVRYEAAADEWKVYLNGVLDTTVDNGGALDAATGTINFTIGGNASGVDSSDAKFDECFFTTQLLGDDDIKKLYSFRKDHNKNVLPEKQHWSGVFFKADGEISNQLNESFINHLDNNSIYWDLSDASTDLVEIRLQNQSFTTTVVPIKTFTTGKQSSDPGTQTHNLGCRPKDFYVLLEGKTLTGDDDKVYNLCSADDTTITCDFSSIPLIDASHRVEIVASCAPVAVAVPEASTTDSGIVTTSAQTIAGDKTLSGTTVLSVKTDGSCSGGGVCSGNNTPTVASETCTGTITATVGSFLQVGDRVTASGELTVTNCLQTETIDLTLPGSVGNFILGSEAGGNFRCQVSGDSGGELEANSGTNDITMTFRGATACTTSVFYQVTYKAIP